MLNDWIALAAVAGSTSVGLAGILATIYGSKRQADAVLAQIAGEGERERQAAQHDEDHRRNRQATYHLFLTAAAQLRRRPLDGVADVRVRDALHGTRRGHDVVLGHWCSSLACCRVVIAVPSPGRSPGTVG